MSQKLVILFFKKQDIYELFFLGFFKVDLPVPQNSGNFH